MKRQKAYFAKQRGNNLLRKGSNSSPSHADDGPGGRKQRVPQFDIIVNQQNRKKGVLRRWLESNEEDEPLQAPNPKRRKDGEEGDDETHQTTNPKRRNHDEGGKDETHTAPNPRLWKGEKRKGNKSGRTEKEKIKALTESLLKRRDWIPAAKPAQPKPVAKQHRVPIQLPRETPVSSSRRTASQAITETVTDARDHPDTGFNAYRPLSRGGYIRIGRGARAQSQEEEVSQASTSQKSSHFQTAPPSSPRSLGFGDLFSDDSPRTSTRFFSQSDDDLRTLQLHEDSDAEEDCGPRLLPQWPSSPTSRLSHFVSRDLEEEYVGENEYDSEDEDQQLPEPNPSMLVHPYSSGDAPSSDQKGENAGSIPLEASPPQDIEEGWVDFLDAPHTKLHQVPSQQSFDGEFSEETAAAGGLVGPVPKTPTPKSSPFRLCPTTDENRAWLAFVLPTYPNPNDDDYLTLMSLDARRFTASIPTLNANSFSTRTEQISSPQLPSRAPRDWPGTGPPTTSVSAVGSVVAHASSSSALDSLQTIRESRLIHPSPSGFKSPYSTTESIIAHRSSSSQLMSTPEQNPGRLRK